MMELFRKILSVLMAFVVLFSTLSFTISEHYCGDHLVDSALFSKAESCGMAIEKPSPNNNCESFKKECCSDVVQQIEGQQVLNVTYTNITPEQQLFIVSFAYSYLNLFEEVETDKNFFNNYSPPLVDKDINVLYRVFRI